MVKALSFDDVLLVPKHTFGGSRDEVSLITNVASIRLGVPLLSANMSSVTETEMIEAMSDCGGVGVLHRMCSPENQKTIIVQSNAITRDSFISVEGSPKEALERLDKIYFSVSKASGICIDVAHADSPVVLDTIVAIKSRYKYIPLIIGNYATPQAIGNVLDSCRKNDISLESISFKVGVGSGSQCTTRIITGCGLPTFWSVKTIRQFYPSINIIADGGFKNSGDIVKALAAGANAVMLGSLLAGTKETPGNVIKHKGQLYKVYRGSASFGQKFERLGRGKYVEGEETLVPYKGSVYPILNSLAQGIRSGFSYCGAKNIKELHENAEFVEITNSGYKESQPHGAF